MLHVNIFWIFILLGKGHIKLVINIFNEMCWKHVNFLGTDVFRFWMDFKIHLIRNLIIVLTKDLVLAAMSSNFFFFYKKNLSFKG